MKTLCVTIYAMILSALLPGAGFAQQPTAPAAAGAPSQGRPKSAGASRAAKEGSKSGKTADAEVDPPFRPRSRPGFSHGHGAALLKKKGAKPVLGAYTKKYQHHPVQKGGEADGKREKPEKAESHASVPGESLKEQAPPPGKETELRPIVRHFTPSAPAPAGNSPIRGSATREMGLFPTPGRHYISPAVLGGGTITSRTQPNAVIGGTSVAGAH
jgi:hypothetical protein